MTYPIVAISNYCNRWCTRCPFTDRCALNATREEDPPGEERAQPPASFPAVSGKFADFLSRLALILPKHGSSLPDVVLGAETERPQPTGLTDGQLKDLAKRVSRVVRKYGKEDWIVKSLARRDFRRADVQAVRSLLWYLPMVGPNYRRSIPRKDAPSSGAKARSYALNARLTHLILIRIIVALTVLLEERQEEPCKMLVGTLTDCFVLLAGIRGLFPEVYKARRPGFDDPGERRTIRAFFADQPPSDPFEDGSWSPGGRPPTT